jgi:hypothetical protein
MFSTDLRTRGRDGRAVAALRGEPDLVGAMAVASASRVLVTIRLADAFCVHATVEEAVVEAETLARARPPDGLQRRARMSLTPEPQHLSNHHRNTLRQLFQHPVSHNIEWNAVVSLLEAVGSVTEQPHGKFAVVVGSETEYFDPPVHKDIDTQAVVNLRRMLSRAGYGLAPRRNGTE